VLVVLVWCVWILDLWVADLVFSEFRCSCAVSVYLVLVILVLLVWCWFDIICFGVLCDLVYGVW